MFQTKVVEKTKTHILCPITFFESHVVNEIMWKNKGPQLTIWCMHVTCWILKATNPHWMCPSV